MHDLVGRRGQDVLDPPLHNSPIEVAAAAMSNGVVAGPAVHGNGVAHNVAVIAGPSGAQGLHVRVAGLQVNRNLLGFAQIGE